MTGNTPTTDDQPHPFDPHLAAQIRIYLDAWKADRGQPYVSQGFFHDGTSQQLTVAQLEQLLEQLAWHKQTGETLAEKCATYRSERDDYHAEADALVSNLAKTRAIIQRVTARMEDSAHHGSGSVNVRQVLNLLSPTWPDGNYSSPPAADLAPPLAPPLRRGARVRLVAQVAHCGPGCEGTVTAILATIHPDNLIQVDVDGYGILNCPPSALERIDTRKDS